LTGAIDQWLPQYQVSASHSVFVHASDEKTYAALEQARFSDLPVVRVLMRIRGYGRGRSKTGEPDAAENVRGPFLELAAIARRALVLGIAGRFWRPDGGIVGELTPLQFADFHRQGYARAVLSFSLNPSNNGTHLTTETRIQTFGRAATLKFRAYWLGICGFSGLIRKAMLREVKRIAEQPTA
jgi:hypothetical protein